MTEITYRKHSSGPVRPYSASATANGIVWACGQIPAAANGSIPSDLGDQVRAAFANLEATLTDAGSSLAHIVKMTVFLADLDEFDSYNEAYLDCFGTRTLPPRTTVEVSRFRGDKRIEIDAVAVVVEESDG